MWLRALQLLGCGLQVLQLALLQGLRAAWQAA